ncbi:hypothetical protein J4480_04140 [Candidatus Woesearchaeota archaeon]|nr:hypothetical protein [Candidatus Woesearchaeota archaeon]
MENRISFGFGFSVFVPATESQLKEVSETIDNKLGNKNKYLAPFLLQYIIRTKDISILKSKNLVKIAKQSQDESMNNARDKIIETLSEYKIFNRELLTIDITNMFQIKEIDVNNMLEDMEKRGRIKLMKDRIELI